MVRPMVTERSLADQLAEDFVRFYSTYEGAERSLTPKALFDINIPSWRFQLQGGDAFVSWLKGYSPSGYHIRLLRTVPTEEGFVLELEGTYSPSGPQIELYFRNLLVCRVSGLRIAEVTYYCTGDWDPETRAHHAHEVKLIRP